jgi:DNA repair protein RadC
MDAKLRKDQLKKEIRYYSDLYPVMQQILLREHVMRRAIEHFWVASLDNKNKLLNVELINIGAANRVGVQPPEIFRLAIYKAAPKVILVHNHPSGVLVPSHEDKYLTDRMMKVGTLINIAVIDHLIISETECFSMAEAGIMKELENNGLFEVTRKVTKEMKEWEEEELKKKAVNERNKEIAALLIKKGLGITEVVEISKLRKSVVEKMVKEMKGR